MATVSDRPRARRARAPRPAPAPVEAPAPRITEAIPEGWQPGGSAPAPAAPSGPPVRHGKCSLTLSIGGTRYRLTPLPVPPPYEACWRLSKIETDPGRAPAAYCVASDGLDLHCTCPDHDINGASCKHMMALVALRLVAAPLPARKGGAK